MTIKRLLLINSFALALGISSIAAADPSSEKIINMSAQTNNQQQHQSGGILTQEQRVELKNYIQNMRQEMLPLLKEKRALKLQLRGKIATPGMQWEELAKLVDQINTNDNKINTVFAKTQFEVFQKLGILLPQPYKHHHFHWYRMG